MQPGELDPLGVDQLDVVRRGYDKQQVEQLVEKLSEQIRSHIDQNDALGAEIERLAAETAASHSDVIEAWSDETNELFEAARRNIALVVERAEADRDEIRTKAELEVQDILAKARTDAEAVAAEATASAAEIIARAEAEVAAAEARVAEADRACEAREAASRADVDQEMTLLNDVREQCSELERNREGVRRQLDDLRAQLADLVADMGVTSRAEQPADEH